MNDCANRPGNPSGWGIRPTVPAAKQPQQILCLAQRGVGPAISVAAHSPRPVFATLLP